MTPFALPARSQALVKQSTQEKHRAFSALHQAGCFVLPNPWDQGSARLLQGLGFKALATSSSGMAWSSGQANGALSRAQTLAHLRSIVAATDLPVNVDFESGFAASPEGVAESVRMAIDTGVSGLSIEDATGHRDAPLRELGDAVARIKAARAAIDAAGADVLLIGRAENFFVGHQDIDDTIKRLQAYSAAGADCLYAPGIRSREHINLVVAAVHPKPVNLLIGSASDFTLQEIASMGVRRVSLGGALARTALAGFLQAARAIAQEGRFDALTNTPSASDLNAFFASSSEGCMAAATKKIHSMQPESPRSFPMHGNWHGR